MRIDDYKEVMPWEIVSDFVAGGSDYYGKNSSLSQRIKGGVEMTGAIIRSAPYLVVGGKLVYGLGMSTKITSPFLMDTLLTSGEIMQATGKGIIKLTAKGGKAVVQTTAKAVKPLLPTGVWKTVKFAGKASIYGLLFYGAGAVVYKNLDLLDDVMEYRKGNPDELRKEMVAYKDTRQYLKDMFTYKDGPPITIRDWNDDVVIDLNPNSKGGD
jgi:hypothetical protein